MKFHLFLGNPCSSDFGTRLGHEATFEVDSWEEFLVQLVEWKIEHLDNEELTKDDLQDEFVWNLFWAVPGCVEKERTCESMLEIANIVKSGSYPVPAASRRNTKKIIAKKIILGFNTEESLIVKENDSNRIFLRYLGVG